MKRFFVFLFVFAILISFAACAGRTADKESEKPKAYPDYNRQMLNKQMEKRIKGNLTELPDYNEQMEKNIDVAVVGEFGTNCWLYAIEDTPDASGKRPCIVIDPGDEGGVIASRLEELNWTPIYIFLTHGHFDHLAGLPDLLEVLKKDGGASPLPKIGIHRSDSQYLGKKALTAHRDTFTADGGSSAYVDALWKPLPDADIILEDGGTTGPFKVLHLPGHTPGSVSLYDEKNGILFSGDTLFKNGYGRTDLPGGDWDQLCESLKRLLSLNGDIVVYPGHGFATTIKEEAVRLGLK